MTWNLTSTLWWIESNPNVGVVVLSFLLVVSNVVCLPVSAPLITASGTIYGLYGGFCISYTTFNLAVTVGCMGSRYLFRKQAMEYVNNHENMKGISRTIEMKGWKFISLLMFPPAGMPTSLISFLVGATTSMPISQYLIGSLIGSIFHIFVLVYFGSLLGSLHKLKTDTENFGLKWLGFGISVAIGIYAWKIVRDEIQLSSGKKLYPKSSFAELSKLV